MTAKTAIVALAVTVESVFVSLIWLSVGQVGIKLGGKLGMEVGVVVVGINVGFDVGWMVGWLVGWPVGWLVGIPVGFEVGRVVGGLFDGFNVGFREGAFGAAFEGILVGDAASAEINPYSSTNASKSILGLLDHGQKPGVLINRRPPPTYNGNRLNDRRWRKLE
jgi:hypothetical protein